MTNRHGASARHDVATRDVVIIGGGIAGLTAAWRLRHRDLVLLEASDRLGGRMRSDKRGEYWLNYGAHLFPAPGSLVDTIATELSLETVPVWGRMMGLAVREAKLTTGPVESYPLRLPLSIRDRAGFAIRGLKVQRAVAAYHRAARPRPAEKRAETRARVLAFEDQRTFADFLGSMSADVEAIFACASHRATAELDELSAGCGIGLFALVWGGKGSLIARNMLGGSGRLAAAIGDRLGPERVRVGAKATGIRDDGDGLVVDYIDTTGPQRLRARHVILAAQAPFAAPLAQEVAPAAADALGQMRYGAFLNVALSTNEQTQMPWDAIYAMATPGRVFDMFTNQAHALRRSGPRRPGGSLMLFAGGHGAAALAEQPDEVIVGRFVDDLVALFPEAAGVIEDAVVQRWPLGNVFARPGRRLLQEPLEGALGGGRNLHLAGDYFAELGNLEAAARTGASAAAHVDRLLSGDRSEETIQ
ncbi:MAG: FAD-dependent oxidoreductase [Chloroflexota bacterium]|nr:FAD-dependent oxidoreductase [Chloroflexota bacterium]